MYDKPARLGDDHFCTQLMELVPQFSRLQLTRDVAAILVLRPRDLVSCDVISRWRHRRSVLRVHFRFVLS